MARGTVKWFSKARGYGYITPDAGGKDVFVHHTAIVGPRSDGFRTVAEGAPVDYDLGSGPRGHEVVAVRPAVGT